MARLLVRRLGPATREDGGRGDRAGASGGTGFWDEQMDSPAVVARSWLDARMTDERLRGWSRGWAGRRAETLLTALFAERVPVVAPRGLHRAGSKRPCLPAPKPWAPAVRPGARATAAVLMAGLTTLSLDPFAVLQGCPGRAELITDARAVLTRRSGGAGAWTCRVKAAPC
jgi:hypothetical protein